MRIPYFQLLMLILTCSLQAAGQGPPGPDSAVAFTGSAVIMENGMEYGTQNLLKATKEKPFHIEAVYEFNDCNNTLSSIEVYNAHFPLTWYELNEFGQRVHTLFEPRLYHFNDHTRYVVQDMSQHTDTIYIDFDMPLTIRRIFPNPHRGMIHIEYSAFEPVELNLSITDMSGRPVLTGSQVLQEGQNTLALNLTSLEQGVYFLSVKGLCMNQLHKIIHLN